MHKTRNLCVIESEVNNQPFVLQGCIIVLEDVLLLDHCEESITTEIIIRKKKTKNFLPRGSKPQQLNMLELKIGGWTLLFINW